MEECLQNNDVSFPWFEKKSYEVPLKNGTLCIGKAPTQFQDWNMFWSDHRG